MQDILSFLQQLAREAGQIMLDHLGHSVMVYRKQDGTAVSQVDLEISARVCSQVKAHYPDLHLMTEETQGLAIQGERGLIIDELDGTNSYLKRKSGFAFQVAYYENYGEVKLALIYDPKRDLMIYAIKGEGVRLHALETTLQLLPPTKRRWQYLRFAHHRTHMPKTFRRVYARLGIGQEQIVATGCISNKVISFALGEVDALVALNRFIPPWDWAPGLLILQELGYGLTHLNGQPLSFTDEPGNTPFGYLVAPTPHLPRLIKELDWVQQKVSGGRHHRANQAAQMA
jgi:fructose-1,6-bisphosphatase/inositol monophosphatase family enzyme